MEENKEILEDEEEFVVAVPDDPAVYEEYEDEVE